MAPAMLATASAEVSRGRSMNTWYGKRSPWSRPAAARARGG
jgi:hypothetical protein